MTITLGVKTINIKMTPFSRLLFELDPLLYFISAIQELQILVPLGPPFA